MGKTKTIEDYEEEITKLHYQLLDYPDSETLKSKLYNQLDPWEKLVEKTIFRDNREQTPWDKELAKLGYVVKDMPTKAEIDEEQVADYVFQYRCGKRSDWGGLLVERKGGQDGKSGPHDIYATFSNKKRRDRFSNEIQRFREDERFNQMIVIAECSNDEFMKYVPLFNGKKRNYDHIGMSVASKEGTIAGLFVKNVPVFFASTRDRAVSMYVSMIRQWLINNYVTVLGLKTKEDPVIASKLIGEDRETLTFEVSGMKFIVPKDAIKVIA